MTHTEECVCVCVCVCEEWLQRESETKLGDSVCKEDNPDSVTVMKPKIKTTCTKLQLHLLSFCLLCLSGKTRCDGNGPAVITVEQGSDAVLPCSLSSKEDIVSHRFDWNKAAQKDGRQKEVFYYDAGVTHDSGRAVSHFPEELKHGNASIIIRNTMVTDSGNYTCVFPHLQSPQTFHIKLVVEPVVVTVEQDRDALLPCSLSTKENISQGHFDWNKVAQNNEKQKEVFQYLKGRHSNTGYGSQDGGFKGRVFHFQEELTHGNASIIIRNTKMADSGDYTCVFLQPRQTFYIKLVVEPVRITVEQGRDALLPCSLSTKENIEQGYFDWNKVAQNNEKQKEVFQYLKGRHSNTGYGSQDDGFKGRVSHFQEELEHGNASIIIRNTKKADNGNYTCVFPESRQTFHIELVVDPDLKDRSDKNIQAKKPFITTLEETKDWSRLQCEVHGASSKPKVEWKDSSGNKLHAEEPQVTYRGGSYDIILQTNVTKTDYYHCVVTQEDISHHTEATIHVYIGEPTVFKVRQDVEIILPCSLSTKKNIESEMFEWKKDGLKEVFFHGGSHYNSNRPGQSEEFKGRVSHFPEELKHGDASITIRNTKMSDSGDYTCDFPRLQPRQISHIKLVVVERGNSGSGANSSGSSTGWIIAVVAVLCTILVVGVILAVLVHKGCLVYCDKKCNKGSPADHKEGSAVPLKSQPSRSEEAPDPET